jgi:uncharacterized membrane protein YgcG
MHATRAYSLATALAAASAACTDSRPGEQLSLPAVGETQQPYCLTHTIINVIIAPGTYHWEDPAHLLNAAEGFGPQVLSVQVAASLDTRSSSSTSYTPSESDISTAVGYDVTESSSVAASTSVPVPFGGYKRVEAYAAYKKSIWDILDSNCNGPDVLNTAVGVSLKPVGVYFKVCTELDCSLGGGLVGGDPLPSGPVDPGSSSSGAGGAGGGNGSSSGSSSSSGSGSGGTGGV